MPHQCEGTTSQGTRCSRNATPGFSRCQLHIYGARRIPDEDAVIQVGTVFVTLCGKLMTNGEKCMCPREKGKNMCKKHLTIEVNKERKRRLRDMWENAMDLLWEGINTPEQFVTFVEFGLEDIKAAEGEKHLYRNKVAMELEHYFLFHPTVGHGVDPPRTELEGLARDNKNVHTPAVNKQTAEAVTALLDTPVAVGQDTLAELQEAWRTRPAVARRSVLKDVSRWYKTSLCRVEGDHLYQRLLDGLWTRVKLSPHKEDLVQRLWEECFESLQMCCEGHISRLCNVLVGFDESFKAPVSIGELLQQKIAAIAEEDVDVLEKVVLAWKVMEELQVPHDQRGAWIDAF